MSWMPMEWGRERTLPEAHATAFRIRMLATVLRIAFIALLLVVTICVSLPQNETIWTAYDTPSDLIRLVLGFGVCAWIAAQLFAAPKDADGHRIWLYLGLVAVPFVLICVVATW